MTAVGEAFNAEKLSEVGNKYFEKNSLSFICQVQDFENKDELDFLFSQNSEGNLRILFPYYSNEKMPDNTPRDKNPMVHAHWSILNKRSDSSHVRLKEGSGWLNSKKLNPHSIRNSFDTSRLFNSNQILDGDFDWDDYASTKSDKQKILSKVDEKDLNSPNKHMEKLNLKGKVLLVGKKDKVDEAVASYKQQVMANNL